jgi:hypothetical protein
MTSTTTTSTSRQDLDELARQIAGELGDGWQVEAFDDGWSGRIKVTNPGVGHRLLLGRFYDTPAGKLCVQGLLPNRGTSYYYRGRPPSIRVAERRGPAVIAKEIVRRLLPGYRTSLAEANEHCAHVDARKRQATECARRLAAVLADGVVRGDNRAGVGAEVLGHAGTVPVAVDIYGDEVSIGLRQVPADLAAALLAQLVTLTDGRTA